MTIQEIKDILAAAGTVGAGGAGFPSGFKLAEGADTLIINAAECEPCLLYTSFDMDTGKVLAKGLCERIGAGGAVTHKRPGALPYKAEMEL